MAFQQGLSGLNAASKALDVTSNNVANSATVGFKSAQAHFADVYANSLSGAGAAQVGIGTSVGAIQQQFTQGNITSTNNPLDISINGDGFYRMSNNGTVTYSRSGQFHLDKNGYVIDDQGRKLTGYLADATGAVVKTAPQELMLSSANQDPVATGASGTTLAGIKASLNFDSRAVAPTAAFDKDKPATYNFSTATSIYDSLGNAHTFTLYTVKVLPPQISAAIAADNAAAAAVTAATAANPTAAANLASATATDAAATATLTSATTANTAAVAAAATAATNDTAAAALVTTATTNDNNAAAAVLAAQTAIPFVQADLDAANAAKAVTAAALTAANSAKSGTAAAKTAADTAAATAATALANAQAAKLTSANNLVAATAAAPALVAANATKAATAADLVAANSVSYPTTDWAIYASVDGTSTANSGLASSTLTFDQSGKLTQGTGLVSANIDLTAVMAGLTPTQTNNAATPLAFEIDFAASTQFGSAFGRNSLQQDGYTSGRLTGVSVSGDGTIRGNYSNGQSRDLGQIALASFTNPNGLTSLGGNQWQETSASGSAQVGAPNTGALGVLQSAAIEESNVDLTAELVNMITQQRSYQANAQSIKTQDQIMQTLVNLR